MLKKTLEAKNKIAVAKNNTFIILLIEVNNVKENCRLSSGSRGGPPPLIFTEALDPPLRLLCTEAAVTLFSVTS